MKKICSKCKIEKPLSEFRFRNDSRKYRNECKECSRRYMKKWSKENKEHLNEWSRIWRRENPERANAICKKYRDTHKKERYITCTNWQKNNPEKAQAIQRKSNKKIRATIQGNLNHRMEVMIRRSLGENKKGRKWETLVGYTLEDLKQHLEKLFTPEMTWEKLLNGEIHIDHKKPKSLFHYKTPEDPEFKDCWSLCNLQPLWAVDNLIKSNKF